MSDYCMKCGKEMDGISCIKILVPGVGIVCSTECFDAIMNDKSNEHDKTNKDVPNDSTIFHG